MSERSEPEPPWKTGLNGLAAAPRSNSPATACRQSSTIARPGAVAEIELRGGDLLAVLEDVRPQLDVAGLVDAVHVAERGGQQVDALLAQTERLGGGDACAGGGGGAFFFLSW